MESIHGMALGNLLISGLIQKMGSLTEAVKTAKKLLDIQGSVLPVTSEFVDLQAELEDGAIVQGELEVRRREKPPILRLGWAGAPPSAAPGVLEALGRADLIVIGPGCLYTSVLACLLVNGVSEGIRDAKALRVYICNTTTTPGQSDDLSVARQVEVVWRAMGRGGLDAVVIHVGETPREMREAYEGIGLSLLLPAEEDLRAIESMGIRVLTMPLLEQPRPQPRRLHKVDTIRHDPAKLRAALDKLARIIHGPRL
jgi:uncharacterized cofD-like protein